MLYPVLQSITRILQFCRRTAAVLDQKPVLLLDDVMGELDADRRRALLAFALEDLQTFITTTGLSYFGGDLLSRADVVELPIKA